jgi:hypothetical protein
MANIQQVCHMTAHLMQRISMFCHVFPPVIDVDECPDSTLVMIICAWSSNSALYFSH